MKKLLRCLLVLGIIPSLASAQPNYKPGYAILSNADTLKGFIDYRDWQKDPATVSFKNSLQDTSIQTFAPGQIKAFAVTGLEYYDSYTVNISQDQVQMSNLRQGVDTSYITKSVFLHLLSAGNNVSLFSYTDDIKTRYYILDKQSGLPRELSYKVFYTKESFGVVQTSYAFRNQLAFLANKYHAGNPKLNQEIAESPYAESELIKITRTINGDSSTQFTPKSNFGFGWVVSAAINSNNLGFPVGLEYPYNSSFFPRISAGIDIFPNVNTQKIFLRCDLSFTQSTHSFSRPQDSVHFASTLNDLTQSTFAITPQIVLNLYNKSNLQVFVNAGVSVNFSFYNNYYLVQSEDGAEPIILHKYPELNKLWINFPLKAGVTFHRKIEVFAGYSPSTQVTSVYSDSTGYIYEYQAGVSYRFGTK